MAESDFLFRKTILADFFVENDGGVGVGRTPFGKESLSSRWKMIVVETKIKSMGLGKVGRFER